MGQGHPACDAHALYAPQGFVALRRPEWFMEINDPVIYLCPACGTPPGLGLATDT